MTVTLPILPGELYPDFPHIVGTAPASHPATTAAELMGMAAPGGVVGMFTVEAGCISSAFHNQRGFLAGYFEAGASILFLCQTRRDRSEALRRLNCIAPASYSIRR